VVCWALGITRVQVRCRPRVAIVSTGDEIVAPDTTPTPGQIRDINTYTIAAASGTGWQHVSLSQPLTPAWRCAS